MSDVVIMGDLFLVLRKGVRCLLNVRLEVRRQSMFKLAFSAAFFLATLVGLFEIFYIGFEFLDNIGGVGFMIINRLFALFFFGLGLLLLISSMITSYTTLYHSAEMPYLLLRPIALKDIIFYKYLESVFMSSWAFFFIILPFIGAYAWYEKLTPLFAFWTLLYCLPFALVSCALGTVATMLLVRFLPRGKPLYLGVAVFLAGVGILALRAIQGVLQDAGTDQMLLLNKLIPGFQFTSHPLWPSYWVADGMMSMTRGNWSRGMRFMVLFLSWVGVLAIAVRQVGAWVFYDGWQRVLASSSSGDRKVVMLQPLERLLGRVLPLDFKALLMKDIRVFLRDPAQWSQGLIFYGILGLYFINLRNLQYHTLSEMWRNIIAFLNVFSVSAVMCSLGARFIYPQLSLEGQGFWIVGMSPVTMGRVLMSKFTAAVSVLILISVILMYISVEMLSVIPAIKGVSLLIACAMSCAVAGMSTGFGAVFLDLKQRNPAAIISSFGGTLNLVVNLGFMFAAIVPFAAIFHIHSQHPLSSTVLHSAIAAAVAYLAVLTLIVTVLPLALGRRSLLRREF